jgi:hypothetical protein
VHVVERLRDWPVSDEAFPEPRSVAELRITVALDGFSLARLEFERWRVANWRDPEWGQSDRQDLSTGCCCPTCRALAGERETANRG